PRVLRNVRLAGRLAEVGLRGGANAVRSVAEVDRVQVLGEDPVLGLLPGQLGRDEDLLELAADRLRRADAGVVVADELLGDGGPALQRGARAGEVVPGRAQDAGGRYPALVVEVP